MRKLMNKKGFSLVELMIVVVIMGILIAVAIPLYGAIQTSANNKTCANNIKAIKSNAATYATSYNVNMSTLAELKAMFDDGNLPECPKSDDGEENDYTVHILANGSAEVQCANYAAKDNAEGEDEHTPDGHQATFTTGTGITTLE